MNILTTIWTLAAIDDNSDSDCSPSCHAGSHFIVEGQSVTSAGPYHETQMKNRTVCKIK
jgi:hypothetical protein